MSAAALPTSRRVPLSARRALGSRDVRLVGGLTLLAFAIRLAFGLAVQRQAFVFNDSFFYYEVAKNLSEGHGFTAFGGAPTAQWPPAWPFLLSLVFRVTGPNRDWAQVANAALAAATVPLLFALVRRVFGRGEALFAAAALVVLPGPILWSDVPVAETLYTFVLVGFFLAVAALPERRWTPAALGLGVGIATLTRGEGLILVVAVLAVWWARGVPRKGIVVRGALLVAVAVLTIAPWTIRNELSMGAFIPLSSNSSITLWSGHNPNADGAQNYAGPALLRQIPQHGKAREIAEAKLLRHRALQFIVHNPRRELELIPLKVFNLVRGDGWTLEWVDAGPPGHRPLTHDLETPIRVWGDFGWFALLAGTIAAVVLLGRALWRRPVTRGILALFAGSLVTYGWVYYGNYRYRAPLEPLMLLLVAPLVTRAWAARRSWTLPPAE